MDENNNKRVASNDILREAVPPKPDVANDETIEFKRDTVRRQTISQNADMQNTAQIRGGAVVRPLRQPTPQMGATPAQPEKKLSPIQAAAQRQLQNPPKPRPAAKPPVQPEVSAKNQPAPATRPAPAPARTSVSADKMSADRVREPQRAPKPTAPAAPVKPQAANTGAATPQNNRAASLQRQLRTEPQRPAAPKMSGEAIKTPVPTTAPSVKQRQTMPTQATRARTENDDFEIDEIATANAKYHKKYDSTDSRFVDSATSAVMSLVKAVIYIAVIIVVSVGLSVFVVNTANDVFKFVVEDKMVTVNIPEYASIEDVSEALYDAGAIKHRWAFNLWSGLKDSGAEFIPGTYEVSTTLNYDYLRAAFKKSTKRVELRVTIPEGYTIDEMIEHLIASGIGNAGDSERKKQIIRDAFIDAINNYEFDYRFVRELTTTEDRIYRLEGYLFPDTYNFYAEYGSAEDSEAEAAKKTAVAVLSKMLDNFDGKFADEYYARCLDLKMTVDQAITLASMIEKETRYADELGYVSSVFHNRLKYPGTFPYLNSDATIMYAIAHDTGSRLDSMSGEDTSYETPYNTYTHRGLPPGPIANPGLNAIKYALYPNDTNYFYFVSDSAGRTLFAATEPEHIANINTVRGR